jgi:hypothetical protein
MAFSKEVEIIKIYKEIRIRELELKLNHSIVQTEIEKNIRMEELDYAHKKIMKDLDNAHQKLERALKFN